MGVTVRVVVELEKDIWENEVVVLLELARVVVVVTGPDEVAVVTDAEPLCVVELATERDEVVVVAVAEPL